MERKELHQQLRNYVRVLFKHRWVILTIFSVVVVSVLIYSFTATPIYQGKARLIIEKENPKIVGIQEIMAVESSGTDYYQTQYKIIESRAVARQVIKRMRLDQSDEFNPRPKGIISEAIASVRETIFEWENAFLKLFKTDEKKPEQPVEFEPDPSLVSAFISKIEIKPIRNSRLVDIGFEAKDPDMAANITNTLSQVYIDYNLETKLKAAQNAVSWLSNQIEGEKKKVEETEKKLLQYKEQQGIITDFSSDVEKITAEKLAKLNALVIEAESKRVEAETRFKQARNLKSTPEMLDSIPEVLSNDLIRQIKKMEVDLQNRSSELSKKYGRNHPQMVAIRSELDTLQKRKVKEVERVIQSLENEYRVALARESSLKGALARQKGESLDLNKKAIDYTVLHRDAESSREMYNLLIKRFKEASLTEEIRTGNIRMVDRAEVPRSPIRPKKGLNILLAMVVGLTLGIGTAFFFDYLDNTIKVPEDIKDYLQIPYLGPVPAFAGTGDSNIQRAHADDLVLIKAPKSTASESYRGLRTSILFSSPDKEPQVIIIGSAGPQEGKTVTSANIAIAMAQAGNRVLIIDGDMRRPRLHRLFGVSRDPGLSNILVGNCELDKAVVATDIPNLDFLPCGPIPPNPSELIGSDAMSRLLDLLRTRYDRVIIDSPPITAVTDTVVLSKKVDGVAVVIRAADTPKELIRSGVEQLRTVNAHILGAILNVVDMSGEGYYYYQYYYYYYGEDGEKRKRPRSAKQAVTDSIKDLTAYYHEKRKPKDKKKDKSKTLS